MRAGVDLEIIVAALCRHVDVVERDRQIVGSRARDLEPDVQLADPLLELGEVGGLELAAIGVLVDGEQPPERRHRLDRLVHLALAERDVVLGAVRRRELFAALERGERGVPLAGLLERETAVELRIRGLRVCGISAANRGVVTTEHRCAATARASQVEAYHRDSFCFVLRGCRVVVAVVGALTACNTLLGIHDFPVPLPIIDATGPDGDGGDGGDGGGGVDAPVGVDAGSDGSGGSGSGQ